MAIKFIPTKSPDLLRVLALHYAPIIVWIYLFVENSVRFISFPHEKFWMIVFGLITMISVAPLRPSASWKRWIRPLGFGSLFGGGLILTNHLVDQPFLLFCLWGYSMLVSASVLRNKYQAKVHITDKFNEQIAVHVLPFFLSCLISGGFAYLILVSEAAFTWFDVVATTISVVITAWLWAPCFRLGIVNVKWVSLSVYASVCAILVVVFWQGILFYQGAVLVNFLLPLFAIALTVLFLSHDHERADFGLQIFRRPEAGIFTFFIGLSLFGALVLKLPLCFNPDNGGAGVIDVVFTAVSAVCVTGLTVFDVSTAMSGFGHFILALFIQLGGLGIMSVSAVSLFFFAGQISLDQEFALRRSLGPEARGGIKQMIWNIFLVTFFTELLGAIILSIVFLNSGDSFSYALGRGLFTAISAFCNAGFSLQTDSMIGYQTNVTCLLTMSVLTIIGGLSPIFVSGVGRNFWKYLTRQPIYPRMSLQTKLVLHSNLYLLIVPFFVFLFLEWNYSLASLNLPDALANAWFHNVSMRTAGFFSMDTKLMTDAAHCFSMLLMFIGGSPGGMAGGIKTTTFAVIVMTAIAVITGRREVCAFDRRISTDVILRSFTIAFCGIIAVALGFFALMLSQNLDPLYALFEVVSALGTVGASLGATMQVNAFGKLVLILAMLVGRVGPLTFFLFLARSPKEKSWKMVKEDVFVA